MPRRGRFRNGRFAAEAGTFVLELTSMEESVALMTVQTKFALLRPLLDERSRRLWAACEATNLKRGGVTVVAKATGLSRTTIWAGMRELRAPADPSLQGEAGGENVTRRIRSPGGGRPPLPEKDPTLIRDLDALIEPAPRGDLRSPLRWTCRSTRDLAEALGRSGHRVSARKVALLLRDLGYRLEANRRSRDEGSRADRNALHENLLEWIGAFQSRRQPVVSVAMREKQWVGELKGQGPAGRSGESSAVVRDEGPAAADPRADFDLTRRKGWVSREIGPETVRFASESLRRWWTELGSVLYPEARSLLIAADSGGGDPRRSRPWKAALQRLADALAFPISVCHLPAATSRWDRVEHRMSYRIARDGGDRPPEVRALMIRSIGHPPPGAGRPGGAGRGPGTRQDDWSYEISPNC